MVLSHVMRGVLVLFSSPCGGLKNSLVQYIDQFILYLLAREPWIGNLPVTNRNALVYTAVGHNSEAMLCNVM